MVIATASAAAATPRPMATPKAASQRGPPANVNTSTKGVEMITAISAIRPALTAILMENRRRGLTGDDRTRSRSPRA